MIITLILSLYTLGAAQTPFIGEIRIFTGNFAPRNWMLCEGQTLQISQNSALFAVIGTIYGGDGRSTFALPDLRGRKAVGAGNGPGLTNIMVGSKGGAEKVSLNVNQIPSHTHTADVSVTTTVKIPVNSTESSSTLPSSKYLGKTTVATYIDEPGTDEYLADPEVTTEASITLGTSGNSQPHENRDPFLAVNYIIAIDGTMPARN